MHYVYIYMQMGHLPTSLSAMFSIKVTIRQMIEGSSKEANTRFAVHTVCVVVTAALQEHMQYIPDYS